MLDKKNIDISNLKIENVDLEQLKRRLSTGTAILFTGAGFSSGTTNVKSNTPPLAKELAKELAKLANVTETEDLMFASEVAMEYTEHEDIINLLKDNYTLKSVSDYHKKICSIPWRRFYTTNYDNSIELASLDVGKRIESVDLSSKASDYSQKENVCVHINGKIDGSTSDDLSSKIKLSDSSYLSPDSFLKSSWSYHFKNDLERASAIVFVGYSMYDLDVKKILYSNPEYREKTYFVVREGSSFQDTFILKKFGHILNVGVNGFSDIVGDINKVVDSDDFFTESLIKYEIKNYDIDIRDGDSEKLLLFGIYSSDKLQSYLRNTKNIPYVFIRKISSDIVFDIEQGENIVIQSDLGNGKSLFLEMLAYDLTMKGTPVFYVENTDGDMITDLINISKNFEKSIIIIDEYSKHLNLVEYVIKTDFSGKLQFVIAGRSTNYLEDLRNDDFNFIEYNLDILSLEEIKMLSNILDNLAAWNEFSSLNKNAKIELIEEHYKSQLSLVLLGLLNSPNIKDKIKSQTDILYKKESIKKTIFSICICEISNVEPSYGLVSEIAGNNDIYSNQLRSMPEFNMLFNYSNGRIKSKSSVLSLSLLNNTFSDIYVMNSLLDIVDFINNSGHREPEFSSIFKSLLRFHIVEKIMPQRQDAIDRYYEKIKIKCPWLMESPHYWVQYAMSRLSLSDFSRAQNYLTNAYEKARNKSSDYHTDNIDTQQARLYLNKSLETLDINESYRLFDDAHRLLLPLPEDGRKFRQVLIYQKVFEQKYQSFSKKQKVGFKHAVKAMFQKASSHNLNPRIIHHAKKMFFIEIAESQMSSILKQIDENR
ncbi:SIR2 family protein [Shewanella avicenniae]|uniref:SIR2 family protein n=1 Tax=Shewanella avicenniae TaxID=2814294 RepID=A0ABX7QMW5_9GAMM|nr:SIR2 family protein [Shewanella avicenniae]QSX32362.1 SIR2 family protein [Shewanella avicenniae]